MSIETLIGEQVRLAICEELERIKTALADEVVRRLAERTQPLERFEVIVGKSPGAAKAFLSRHPVIRALGIRVGRSLLFRREELLLALRQRDDRPRLQAIGGRR